MRRFSFTLTELLVVIVIFVLLIVILLPSLRSSRQQAEAVLCNSNIRQLLLGLFSYENESQTLLYGFDKQPLQGPPPGGYAGGSAYDRRGWWWFNFIEGFYKKSDSNKTVVCCPSKRLTKPELKNNVLCSNYGANQSIFKSPPASASPGWTEFVGEPLRSSNIRRPGETLLLVDSGYAIISWWHAADEPPVVLGNTIIEDAAYIPGLWINKKRDLWPGQEQDAIYGRHPNKTVNVEFADGHVSRTKAEDLFVEKTGDDYRNKSPLWVPK